MTVNGVGGGTTPITTTRRAGGADDAGVAAPETTTPTPDAPAAAPEGDRVQLTAPPAREAPKEPTKEDKEAQAEGYTDAAERADFQKIDDKIALRRLYSKIMEALNAK